ncbi:hypothetical protein DR088_03670, partial [Mycoplasma hyopneumoniae]|nr:hypothetical protein [Mesomycoplasma hyopneumoniae]MXR64255.1 hypothetical protein [Mesomycoplasma hyopneumoniae]
EAYQYFLVLKFIRKEWYIKKIDGQNTNNKIIFLNFANFIFHTQLKLFIKIITYFVFLILS